MAKIYDCIIIGGGPAGLTAAIYLARLRCSTLVFDSGKSRAQWIPTTYNYPGFPEGISGLELIALLKTQAIQYGAKIIKHKVLKIVRDKEGFSVFTQHHVARCKRLLIATGVSDVIPNLPGTRLLLRQGLMRLCPICDGYEAINKHVGVIAENLHGVKGALFLKTFSEKICVLSSGKNIHIASHDVTCSDYLCVLKKPIKKFGIVKNKISVGFADKTVEYFDLIYAALGVKVNNALVAKWEATLNSEGSLRVDKKQRTSIPFLYAAGDVVEGLSQLSVAVGQAAIAAVNIHNSLK